MDYDYRALVYGMTDSGGTKVEIDVTIPEGYTLKQIFALMETNGVCTAEELWDAAANYDFDYDFLDSSTLGNEKRLEGYLFPDTYTCYVGDKPTRVINKMLSNFNNKFTDEYKERAAELGYSVADIINIAAMIEKEAANDEERANIASVIYNRLNSSSFPTCRSTRPSTMPLRIREKRSPPRWTARTTRTWWKACPSGRSATPGLPPSRRRSIPNPPVTTTTPSAQTVCITSLRTAMPLRAS
jgi:UPF0755 protein